ncbi:MAG: hypothetical protein NDJ18_08615 [candidate division Zixibacteria bacterium]|nr:hypothetical protein [candidate division Zixibacteria bacterium]
MKARVLLVAYYFPPLGMAGVGRPLNLFKQLPTFGYDCDILTVKPVAYRRYEPELLDGLDLSRIYRAGSFDPQRIMYLLGIRQVNPRTIARGSVVGEKLFPDSKIGWVRPAVRLGKKLHARNPYAAVISTSPPISSHLVGMRLANECDIKWIADFRDLWTMRSAEETYADAQARSKAVELRKQFRDRATAITAVNPAIQRYVQADEIITNGFDPETAVLWGRPAVGSTFNIGLLGSFNDQIPIEPLLKVIRRAIDLDPALADSIRLTQVGDIDPSWLEQQLSKYGLRSMVDSRGYKPREESIKLLAPCAMMYIGIERGLGNIGTSRIFDLLASGRPLMIYGDRDSELARLTVEAERFLFDDNTIDTAANYLHELNEKSRSGRLVIAPLPDHARQHAWGEKAEQFAKLLDRII